MAGANGQTGIFTPVPRLPHPLFRFTRAEQRGLAVLGLLVMLLSGAHFWASAGKELPERNYAAFDQLLAANAAPEKFSQTDTLATTTENEPEPIYQLAGEHSIYSRGEKFYFDPNQLPEYKWVKLGLTPAQARSVKKFEASGGKFRYRQDVKKLFVISPEFYTEIEPYIALPDEPSNNAAVAAIPAASHKPRLPEVIELNAADTSALMHLEGIGPVFARRIVAYRQRLGGFYSPAQLTEVFGFDEERLEMIDGKVKTDSTYIRKINVNTASAAELKKHPYFTPVVANAVVNYRNAHGPFRNLPEVMRCQLFGPDLYRKLAPYLTL
ncbi:MAG: helix-hairpin-helix domain-containing protein [Bacteroidia bacterium]|nr:helix-hairpin-helix domain-containing protein [Bacteroidia bacterium]